MGIITREDTPNILPSSRAKITRGATKGKWGVYWIPIFCANCGIAYGKVPEETTTFAFWLCVPCFDRYGLVAGTMVEPETVFWTRVNAEMVEKYGRVLEVAELQNIVDADSSPLASLIKEGALNR